MSDTELRVHLVQLLQAGEAHLKFEDVVRTFPVAKSGIRPAGSPHSAWELLEHIRIAQEDIVLFSGAMEEKPRGKDDRNPPKGYVALKWPDDYWPKSPAPRDGNEWKQSVVAVERDLASFIRMIKDPKRELFEPFPWGEGQTLLREALLIADHNSHHLGQLILVRKIVEAGAATGQ
jgi:hypothetical protein